MSESESLTLSKMPLEILLDNVLPFVPAEDLLNLARCSKLFAMLCDDNTLWKHKLSEDFNFTGEGTARTSGWKFIYRGIFNPRVYVWGDKTNGRLGLQNIPKSVAQGVPYPVGLRLPGIRIVSIVAGGMSFQALDSNGNVYVWGTLNGVLGLFASATQGFSNNAKQARTPHKLSLPVPIRSISCGRLHSSCLDHANEIWTFTNWGRPFKLSATILQDPEYTPKQIECGWTFSSILTKSGDVFVWWPFAGRMGEIVEQRMRDMDKEGDKRAYATQDGVIPCVTWDMDEMPTRLPAIPPLADLPNTGNTPDSEDAKLIQIAAFDQHILGLTNRGHVLIFGSLPDDSGVANGQWEYLPNFSEVERIREQPAFLESHNGEKLAAPQTMQITHITANFLHFVAYSTGASSIVLIGDTNTTPQSAPKIIPQLQNESVISVVLGDYHNAALKANGKLLTWGGYSHGALGLGEPTDLEPGTPGAFANENDRAYAVHSGRGEPPNVEIPTEVRFDHKSKTPRKRFCFAATAAGWHTGALVIDLEPREDEDEEIETTHSDEPISSVPQPSRSRWETPPFVPLPGIFRVGYAGRGRGIGGFQRARGNGPPHNSPPRPPNQGDAS